MLTSGVGAGAAWAVQLPLGVAAGVGVAMLAAASVAKALSEPAIEPGLPRPPELRGGTPQAVLVDRLAREAKELAEMVPAFAGTSLGSSVVEASTSATGAVDAARRLGAAISAVDDALRSMAVDPYGYGGTSASAHRLRKQTQAAIDRLQVRRVEMLSRIEVAYLRAAEVRARLLEVAAALHAPSIDPAETGLLDVSENLEELRRGLAELESTAASERPLPDDRG